MIQYDNDVFFPGECGRFRYPKGIGKGITRIIVFVGFNAPIHGSETSSNKASATLQCPCSVAAYVRKYRRTRPCDDKLSHL